MGTDSVLIGGFSYFQRFIVDIAVDANGFPVRGALRVFQFVEADDSLRSCDDRVQPTGPVITDTISCVGHHQIQVVGTLDINVDREAAILLGDHRAGENSFLGLGFVFFVPLIE